MQLRLAGAALAACLLAGAAAAAPLPADQSASVKARNAEIVAKTPGAEGVFAVQDNGDVRHLQSGLRCPASFPNVAFWHAEIFTSAEVGGDVSCDYGRSQADGRVASKLTIFATKADGASIDEAFAADKAGIVKSTPGARLIGPALHVRHEGAKGGGEDPLGDFRSAEYEMEIGGVHHLSDLIVTIRSGWVIEIRATFATEVSDPDAAASAVGDAAAPVLAFIQAVGGVGKAGAPAGR